MPDDPTPTALPEDWAAHSLFVPAPDPALLELLGIFCPLLDGPNILNLALSDLLSVMRPATALVLARATAGGAGRAARAAHSLLASFDTIGIRAHAVSVLLAISSPDAAELQMDELTEITETIQQHLGPDVEMIFGHATHLAAEETKDAGLRLTLLVGFGGIEAD